MDKLLKMYMNISGNIPIMSITPTRYEIPLQSIFALNL